MNNTLTRRIACILVATLPFATHVAAQEAASPSEEAAAFLASPTSLAAAITTVEAATGGKVSTIEFVMGEDGMPNLIMADAVMPNGKDMEVSVNPVDGAILKIAEDQAEDDATDDDDGSEDEDDDEDGN